VHFLALKIHVQEHLVRGDHCPGFSSVHGEDAIRERISQSNKVVVIDSPCLSKLVLQDGALRTTEEVMKVERRELGT
jgi:hypothetical protein